MESYDVHLWSFLLYSYPCKEDRKEMYDFFPLIKQNTNEKCSIDYRIVWRTWNLLCKYSRTKRGDMILVGRSQNKLDAQAKEAAAKYHVEIHTIVVDLSKPEAAQIIYDTCQKKDWLPEIAVNVETPTRILKLFLKDMIQRGNGKVLNVSSTAAVMPGPLQAVYYATKAYMTSFSNALWRELKDTGVTVTTLMPGAMSTGFANAGGLGDTALFAKATSPMPVAKAKAGYEGMEKGELNVTASLVGAQKIFMPLSPMMPKKMLMNNVYGMQLRGSANK